MKVCMICGEKYDQDETVCPYCGCPEDRFSFENMGFPAALNAEYKIIGFKDNEAFSPSLILSNRNNGQRVMAARIPEGNGCRYFFSKLKFQKKNKLRELPGIISVYSEEGFYLYEEIQGKTLQSLLERENPLSPRKTDYLMIQIQGLIMALRRQGFIYGPITPYDCCINKNGVHLISLGSDEWKPDDAMNIARLRFRLMKGRWPDQNDIVSIWNYLPDQNETGGRPWKMPMRGRIFMRKKTDMFGS